MRRMFQQRPCDARFVRRSSKSEGGKRRSNPESM
jgi:hypothetical protein